MAGEGAPPESAVVKAVRARLQAKPSAEQQATLRRWQTELGVGDPAILALKMLAPEDLKEMLAGERVLKTKLAGDPQANVDDVIMWLVSQLDSEVEGLVAQLQAIDAEGASARSSASVPATQARPLVRPTAKSAPWKAAKLSQPGILRSPPPKIAAARAAAQARARETSTPAPRPATATPAARWSGDVVSEARARLVRQKTPANTAAVQRLHKRNNFSDEVLLALRLLPDARLQELALKEDALTMQLAESGDRSQSMMSMIWLIDPEVKTMVGKLKELDGKARRQSDHGSNTDDGPASSSRAHLQPQPSTRGSRAVAKSKLRLVPAATAASRLQQAAAAAAHGPKPPSAPPPATILGRTAAAAASRRALARSRTPRPVGSVARARAAAPRPAGSVASAMANLGAASGTKPRGSVQQFLKDA